MMSETLYEVPPSVERALFALMEAAVTQEDNAIQAAFSRLYDRIAEDIGNQLPETKARLDRTDAMFRTMNAQLSARWVAVDEYLDALRRIKDRAERVLAGELDVTARSVADYDVQVATRALNVPFDLVVSRNE